MGVTPERAGRRSWHKATASGVNGCVEVALDGRGVLVRDSKDPHGPRLRYTLAEWRAFVQGVKQGEFDRLTEL